MARGRPTKPTAAKKLEGNPGKRALPVEPKLEAASLSICPDWIPEFGKKLWDEKGPMLRRDMKVTSIDEPAMLLMCMSFGFAMQAAKKLKREGLVRGNMKNPVAQIWRDNMTSFHNLAAKFGMTPSDRSRLFTDLLTSDTGAGATSDDVLNGDFESAMKLRPN